MLDLSLARFLSMQSFLDASVLAATQLGAALSGKTRSEQASYLVAETERLLGTAPGGLARWAPLLEDVKAAIHAGEMALATEVVVRLAAHETSQTWDALLTDAES